MNASPDFILRLKNLFSNVLIVADTPLESFCKDVYAPTRDKAYTNKRKAFGQNYNVFLNELITPRAWEVKNFIGPETKWSTSSLDVARAVGKKVATTFTWTDDKNLDTSGDYYLFPSEAIKLQKCDCEDHAFVVASCAPEHLGVAYGFWNGTGHAFNVFVHEGELYVLDTVENVERIKKYNLQKEYAIHFIITEKYTFKLIGGTEFGEIAGWTK